MQIRVAEHSGFCFGVRRAIDIVEKTLGSSKDKQNIYSSGPIIHNPEVVKDLSRKGLTVIDDISKVKKGTFIISSHGAPKYLVEKIRRKGIKLIDATCPFVKYAQNIVKELKRASYRIVIIGDKSHPEVKALLSLAGRDALKGKKIGIISQTTQDKESYIRGILDVLKGDFNEVRIFNTICNDTSRRQASSRAFLKECDVMIVVGGRNSANTKRLYEICKERGVDTYHIETAKDIKRSYFDGKRCVGVVSGASTPDTMVKKVVDRIKGLTNVRG